MKNRTFETGNRYVLEMGEQDYSNQLEDIPFGNHFIFKVKKSGILLALIQKKDQEAFEKIQIKQWGVLYKNSNGKRGIGSIYRKKIVHKIKSRWETK